MLLELSIENFILIDKVRVNFSDGLNIITGETGAGKSIIIEAINLLLGGKASREYIKRGKDKAIIQGVFQLKEDKELTALLQENSIDTEDEILILSREIFDSGKSIARANGRIVPIGILKNLGELLVDIHGQHEHQSLLYPEKHINMIDLYGQDRIKDIKSRVKEIYSDIKKLEEELKNSFFDDKERERKIDILDYQINEIDSSNLRIGEDEELFKQYNLLKNSKDIYFTVNKAYNMISSGIDGEGISILSLISSVLIDFETISGFDGELKKLYDELQDINYRLEDIATSLRHYGENIIFDNDLLVEVENRIDHINNLKRKYGNTIEEILKYRDYIYAELTNIKESEERINRLTDELRKLKDEYYKEAKKLSDERKKIIKDFEEKITEELQYLNLKNARFKVNIEDNKNHNGELVISSNGIDKVEFIISTNPGEPLKPLVKVASGGEISRIMLAMKSVFAEIDNIPTLIFDEIDTGISGNTANVVGERLSFVSKNHQLICITHLPQIAVIGDYHIFIEKKPLKDDTKIIIRPLDKEDRVKEISRLIGGNVITELTIKNAEELLQLAERIKK